MKSEKRSAYWKVPSRQVYCETFRQWVGEIILCHVYYRLCQPILPKIPGDE